MIFELTKKIMKKFNNDNNKTDRTLKTEIINEICLSYDNRFFLI